MTVGEGKKVSMSMYRFPMAVTSFLVMLAMVIVVFKAKYVRGRVRGRGPVGLLAQPRHTFAQYDDDEGEEDADEG